ncbi:Disease resistance protein RGA2, partial [Mucuna pruriens]
MAAFKKIESLQTFLDLGFQCQLPPNHYIRDLRTRSFLLSPLKDLAHLRYLHVYGSSVKSLPDSICGLQKLQTLKLKFCGLLNLLPKDLTQLQDLRHLVINGCYSIAEMPPKIGKLSHLRTLSTFIVGSKTLSNPGHGLAELHGLKLGGRLHIRNLENVPSEWDAKQANLISKKDLNRLYLSWGGSANSQGNNVNAERVLEALEPPSILKSFGMNRYKGIQLPHWMRNPSVLKDLVEVILCDCVNCEELPPLGKLAYLKSLFVSGMNNVKYIDGESYNSVEEKAFPSLEKFTVEGLPNLERMLRDEGVEMLPHLSILIISGVSNLKVPRLPSVEFLRASNIKEGASFMEGVVGNMPCLKTLQIDSFQKLKVLPDQFSSLGALQKLKIDCCGELEYVTEHVLRGLTSLQTLEISYCTKLKSLPEGMEHLACLERFCITDCPELVALSSNMNQLTSLREVSIDDCSVLPEGLQDWLGDMTSLRQLHIYHCRELRLLPSNMNQLTTLKEVSIASSVLPEGLQDWLGDMTSLREIKICECSEFRSVPGSFQRLTNLGKLTIEKCPELEKRCKRETGEDWQYIAHIPQLELKISRSEKRTFTFCETIRSSWSRNFYNPGMVPFVNSMALDADCNTPISTLLLNSWKTPQLWWGLTQPKISNVAKVKTLPILIVKQSTTELGVACVAVRVTPLNYNNTQKGVDVDHGKKKRILFRFHNGERLLTLDT